MYCRKCGGEGHYAGDCQLSGTLSAPKRITKPVPASVTKPIMRYPVTQGDGVTRHCPTCTCEHIKVHESPAAKQRAYRERRKAT